MKTKFVANLIGTSLFFSLFSGIAMAEMPMEMPASEEIANPEFAKIEQPLALKLAVTLGGVGLIGLELWWFLYSKQGKGAS